MATLTQVSFLARRGIKYGAVVLVILMLLPLAWRLIRQVYLTLRPPPPPPPTVSYGKLPKLYFPAANPSYKPTLRLETVDGKLPVLPLVSKVYLVDVNKSRLLQLDRIKAKAKVLGFVNEPEKLNDQTFKFIHPTLPLEMSVDVIYNSYAYKYDWTLDQDLYTAPGVPRPEQAFLEAKNFWQSLGLLAQDLADGTAKYSYFSAQPPEMLPVASLSEANFVRVDIFRADKDKLRIVTTSGNSSPVSVIFSGSTDRGKRIIEANYIYSKTVDEDFATYPLKGVQKAWEELQQGGGLIAVAGPNSVPVRKISLAYYESREPQEFLQPVYVFEGDGGFIAYISAIDATYVQ